MLYDLICLAETPTMKTKDPTAKRPSLITTCSLVRPSCFAARSLPAQKISHQKLNDIIVIVDHNKIQSSEFVKKIIDLRDLKKKIESFGWFVKRCNGHNFKKLKKIFLDFKKNKNKQKL